MAHQEEGIVSIVRAWYPSIQSFKEIKRMVWLWEIVKKVLEHGEGRIDIRISSGRIQTVDPSPRYINPDKEL